MDALPNDDDDDDDEMLMADSKANVGLIFMYGAPSDLQKKKEGNKEYDRTPK